MMSKNILFSTLLILLSFNVKADNSFRYLGFEFNTIPQKEVLKDYKCSKIENDFKRCSTSSKGRAYYVILDKDDKVRKVGQSISTSSYTQSFSCLEHLKSYANVLNENYNANIVIPAYGLFSDFDSTINTNNQNFIVLGQCANQPEDVVFKASIEDEHFEHDYSSVTNSNNNGISNIERDFQ